MKLKEALDILTERKMTITEQEVRNTLYNIDWDGVTTLIEHMDNARFDHIVDVFCEAIQEIQEGKHND